MYCLFFLLLLFYFLFPKANINFGPNIIPPNFNEKHVVLNLKIKNPTKITQFYPISLSNVIPRIASKVLANRLKCLFPKIISENQSVFLSEYLITNNVLVAFETMHHIIQKRARKVGEMAIKLDMSKAYDRWNGVVWRKLCPRWVFMSNGLIL